MIITLHELATVPLYAVFFNGKFRLVTDQDFLHFIRFNYRVAEDLFFYEYDENDYHVLPHEEQCVKDCAGNIVIQGFENTHAETGFFELKGNIWEVKKLSDCTPEELKEMIAAHVAPEEAYSLLAKYNDQHFVVSIECGGGMCTMYYADGGQAVAFDQDLDTYEDTDDLANALIECNDVCEFSAHEVAAFFDIDIYTLHCDVDE